MLLADDIGTVGGAAGLAAAVGFVLKLVYELWEKKSLRQTAARREVMADVEAQLKLDEMAKASLASAFAIEKQALLEAADSLKRTHDAEMVAIRSKLSSNERRIRELEAESVECKARADGLAAQNAKQALQIEALTAANEALQRKLKETGALPPGSGLHFKLETEDGTS